MSSDLTAPPAAPAHVDHVEHLEPGSALPPPTPEVNPARGGRVVTLLQRYWATTLLVAGVLVAGLATGALWRPIEQGSRLHDQVAYGLPALLEGRWSTIFTGAFFTPRLVIYIPVLLLLILAAGTYERRVGHWRTLLVVIGGQALGALVTAGFLRIFTDSGWTWAVELGRETDLGISAGGYAVIAALTAVMQPVWRRRVRVGLSAFLVVMVFESGLLWDVEHLAAWTIGLVAGPFLVGRRPQLPRLGFGPRTQRALVALIIAVSAVASLIDAAFPGNGGPFHTGDIDREHPTSVTLVIIVSAILRLIAADGLRRGRRVAWVFVTALFGVSFVGLFFVEPSAERTAHFFIVGGQLLLLLATYRAFTARSRRKSLRIVARRLFIVAVCLFAYTALGFWALKEEFVPEATPADMIGEFFSRLVFQPSGNIEPQTRAADWFVTSIGAVWIVTIIITGVGLIYQSRRPRPIPDEDTRLRALLSKYPSSSIAWMLTWKGNTIWFSTDGETAIGYRIVGSVALCLGDPVGPLGTRAAALKEFDEYCFRHGWLPCLFAAGTATAEAAPDLGWKAVQVAEDGVVHLEHLEFKGKQWQDIRTAINKAGKQDVRLVVTKWADAKPVVTDQLTVISGAWVADKSLPEMGFTLGGLEEADDPAVRLHLAVDADETIEGFTSWMPVSENDEVRGWTLDLMRRRDQGFRPVMEFMIGASAMQLKEEGYRFISLSAAPLAKAPDSLSGNSDQKVLQKLLDFLGDALEPYYGFQSLFAFKRKFQPELLPMYLVYPDETALAEIGIAVARAYMPDATLKDWVSMTAQMLRPHKELPPPTPAPAPTPQAATT